MMNMEGLQVNWNIYWEGHFIVYKILESQLIHVGQINFKILA